MAVVSGGALALLADRAPYDLNLIVSRCRFVGSSCTRAGGALSLSGASEVDVSESTFDHCAAGVAGGAVWLADSCVRFSHTFFVNNSAGTAVRARGRPMPPEAATLEGGAAIAFASGSAATSLFATDDCVFVDNTLSARRLGDVAVSSGVSYRSFGDTFSRAESAAVHCERGATVEFTHPRFSVAGLTSEQRALAGASDGRLKHARRHPGLARLAHAGGRRAPPPAGAAPARVHPHAAPAEPRRPPARIAEDETTPFPLPPGFQPAPTPETLDSHTGAEHVQVYEFLTAHTGPLPNRVYVESVLHVVDSTFSGTRAIGGLANDGLGGAVLVYRSQLVLSGDSFEASRALAGGAVAAIDSDVLVLETAFAHCVAYFEGGAVLVRCSVGDPLDGEFPPVTEKVAFFNSTTFTHNLAREAHGAIAVIGVEDVTVSGCTFADCHAGFEAGAVGAVDSNVIVFDSKFFNCSAGGRLGPLFKDLIEWYPTVESLATDLTGLLGSLQARAALGNRSRGGALFFTRKETNPPSGRTVHLSTEQSCFAGNALYGALAGDVEPRDPGFDVYVGGDAKYQSFNDRFLNDASVAVFHEAAAAAAFYRGFFYTTADRFFSAGGGCPEEVRPLLEAFSPVVRVTPVVVPSIPAAVVQGGGEVEETSQTEPASLVFVSEPTPFGRIPQRSPPPGVTAVNVEPPEVPKTPTPSAAFSGSPVIAPSSALEATDLVAPTRLPLSHAHPASRAAARTAPFAATGAFTASAGFSASVAFAPTGDFAPTAPFTPTPSTASVSETPMPSETDLAAGDFYTMSIISQSASRSESLTMSFLGGGVWSEVRTVVFVSIPFYSRVVVRPTLDVAGGKQEDPSGGISDGAVIGIATGGALVLFLLIGGAVYMVRARGLLGGGDDDDDGQPKRPGGRGKTQTALDYSHSSDDGEATAGGATLGTSTPLSTIGGDLTVLTQHMPESELWL